MKALLFILLQLAEVHPVFFRLIPMTVAIFNRYIRPTVYNGQSSELDF